MTNGEQHNETLEQFIERAADWADGNFPYATLHSIAKHLDKEAGEFLAATDAEHGSWEQWVNEEHDEYTPADIELADNFLLVIHAARRRRISLLRVAQYKLAINQKRPWGKPDADGVVEHIREPAEFNPLLAATIAARDAFAAYFEKCEMEGCEPYIEQEPLLTRLNEVIESNA